MSNADQSGADELNPRVLSPAKSPTRPSDAPAAGRGEVLQSSAESGPRPSKPTPSGRVLAQPRKPVAQSDRPSVFHRSLGAVRMALPVLQKMLPLLEGNVATVVSNLLAPSFLSQPPDFTPLENALGKMHAELAELRNGVAGQSTLLKRVGDQVDLVKEAADRISMGQQEMLEDLHNLRKKVSVFAWLGLVLLVVSIALNVVLLLRVERVLP